MNDRLSRARRTADAILWIVVGFMASAVIAVGIVLAQTSHPCDTTPASLTSVLVGQPFTFGWCEAARDVNGNPTTITGYEVYRNGAPFASVPISAQSAPNAAGLVYVSIQQTELAPGPVQWEVSAMNAQGESARGGPLNLSVFVVPGVAVAPSKLRLTVP